MGLKTLSKDKKNDVYFDHGNKDIYYLIIATKKSRTLFSLQFKTVDVYYHFLFKKRKDSIKEENNKGNVGDITSVALKKTSLENEIFLFFLTIF